MKNIAFITLEYPPYKGGVGRYTHTIRQCFTDEETILFSPENVNEPRSYKTSFVNNYIWPRWLFSFIGIARKIRKYDINHVYAFQVLPIGLMAVLLKKLFKIPFTVFTYGIDITQHLSNTWKKKLIKIIFSHAHSIVTISNFSKKALKMYGPFEWKTLIVPPIPYCTPEAFEPNKPDVELPKNYILSVGRLVKRKNYEKIIEAVARNKKSGRHTNVVIVGDGPLLAYLTAKAKVLEVLHHGVYFLTHTNDNELSWLYTNALGVIFIPTSKDMRDIEGFGIVAAEAGAFKKAIIASNEGGVSDVVKKENGILIDPDDVTEISESMYLLCTNSDSRNRYGNNHYNYVTTHFSRDNQLSAIKHLDTHRQSNISIIIPVYNSKNTLIPCIQSIQTQTVPPKEVILINDGSTDGSDKILDTYAATYTVQHQDNKGAPSARNAGASRATGDYILFLDSDIIMNPTMLEKMLMTLQNNPKTSYAYSQFYFGWKKFSSQSFDPEKLYSHNYIHTSSLIRKVDFPGFDESLRRHQDWDLWLTMLEHGKTGMYINEILYKIQTEKERISRWVPSFMYSLPGSTILSKQVREYNKSAEIIKKKHQRI